MFTKKTHFSSVPSPAINNDRSLMESLAFLVFYLQQGSVGSVSNIFSNFIEYSGYKILTHSSSI